MFRVAVTVTKEVSPIVTVVVLVNSSLWISAVEVAEPGAAESWITSVAITVTVTVTMEVVAGFLRARTWSQ